MFGALEFSEKLAAPASSRSSAARWRSISATPTTAPATAMRRPARERIVLLAAREAGYRSLMRLSSRAFLDTPPNEPPHLKLAWLEGETDGLIALTGGPGRAARSRDRRRPEPSRRHAARRAARACSATGSMSSCSATAPPNERTTEPALIDLAYGKGIPLVATNEPYFASAARLRGARRADLHRRGPAARRDRPPPAHRRAPLQEPRRDGRAVRRSAGGARLHGRDRRALRLPPAHAAADPAALLGRRQRGRRGDRTAQARRGRPRAPARQRRASRPAAPKRNTASGSTSSSASSRA